MPSQNKKPAALASILEAFPIQLAPQVHRLKGFSTRTCLQFGTMGISFLDIVIRWNGLNNWKIYTAPTLSVDPKDAIKMLSAIHGVPPKLTPP